jgi:VanZ family protein
MKTNFRKIVKYWLPVLIWAGIIFIFSSNPAVRTTEIHWEDFIIKKSAHIFFFGVLSVFFYRAYKSHNIAIKKSVYYAIVSVFLYGVIDEIHQSFTPGRDPRLRDIMFDTFGAILFMYFIRKILPKFPKKIFNYAKKFEVA